MKFEEMKEMLVDLSSIGGQNVSIGEMVRELRTHRRNAFFRLLFSIEEGQRNGKYVFDAIGFLAAIEDFEHSFHEDGGSYEGNIIYDVTAGGDWVWHCKTTITWQNTFPILFGYLQYHTDVIENENVNKNRINAMSGTGLEIHVIKKELRLVTQKEALERSKPNN